ncbi:hypothetical protein Ddc_14355 [Ditylenchus destructor]|nr:hypothetical protein Ddc_14355 [Ditylenchus destructor]
MAKYHDEYLMGFAILLILTQSVFEVSGQNCFDNYKLNKDISCTPEEGSTKSPCNNNDPPGVCIAGGFCCVACTSFFCKLFN